MRIGAAILLFLAGGTLEWIWHSCEGILRIFTLIKQIAVRSSPTFSVGMGVAPMA